MNKNLFSTQDGKGRLLSCILYTYAFGMVAHLYGLVNGLFSHDSLNALVATRSEEIWKVQLGRFLAPVYRQALRGNLAIPWLIGLIAFAYIALAVYLICELFSLRSRGARLLVSGVFTTGITVSALIATYSYEFDIDMLAFLLAVLAVWLYQRKKWGFLWGALILAASLALYQAYIAATIALCLMLCLKQLTDGDDAKSVTLRGTKAIAMLLIGGLIYALTLRIVSSLSGISMDTDTYNGLGHLSGILSSQLPALILRSWTKWFTRLGRLIPAFSAPLQYALHIALFCLAAHALLKRMRGKGKAAIALAICLVVLLPLGMNAVYALDGGMLHDLMVLPTYCVYVLCFFLLLGKSGEADATPSARYIRFSRAACAALTGVLLFGNVLTANALYLKKDLEKQATLSYMTRAVERIETYPGYERGVTPVSVYGVYEQAPIAGFEAYSRITGLRGGSAVTVPLRKENFDLYGAYFSFILNCNVKLCSLEQWRSILDSEQLKQMPCFPDLGCVEMIDGVLVLKMGERYRIDD